MRGFSLVELMVSIVIGLVILAALVALFVNTSGSNRELARANSLIENGRLAIELLESDVVHAGLLGHVRADVRRPDAVGRAGRRADGRAGPVPRLRATPWTDDDRINFLHVPVQVYDSDAVCGGVILDQLAGTDVLVVRHAELCVAGDGDCEADEPASCTSSPRAARPTSTRYVLGTERRRSLQPEPDGLRDRFRAAPFVSNIYYVRDYAVTAGDGIPTLMRSTFDLDAGGELSAPRGRAGDRGHPGLPRRTGRRRSQRGLRRPADRHAGRLQRRGRLARPRHPHTPTNRGDGSPDGAFVSCTTAVPCTVDQLMNVTAVKINLLVRSRDASPAYSDAKTYQLARRGARPVQRRLQAPRLRFHTSPAQHRRPEADAMNHFVPARERGAALVVGLIMLVLITIMLLVGASCSARPTSARSATCSSARKRSPRPIARSTT